MRTPFSEKRLEVADEKEFRKELASHMWHMHGEFSTKGLGGLNVEQLEKVHELFHIDDYCCPPHMHEVTTDPYVLPPIWGVDPDYLKVVTRLAKGEKF